MAEPTDHELLARFSKAGDESAFAALVTRHINLVYSAARRFANDGTAAEEITQAVFILLARKAGGISPRVVLTGWLYQAARLTAANALKEKIRRQKREHQAYMDSTLNQPDAGEAWKQIAPVLDDAMNALRTTDRDAVLLRYFENKPLAEVGAALGVSEDAARVRVNRALEKLRRLLTGQGVTLGATVIAGAMLEGSVKAAPVNLAQKIANAAKTSITATVTTTAFVSSILGKISIVGAASAIVLVSAMVYSHSKVKSTTSSTVVPPTDQVMNARVATSNQNNSPANIIEEEQGKINGASEHLRRALHTAPTTHVVYDSVAITNAIEEFGLYRRTAFNVLLENAADSEERVRAGSIYGMGYVGRHLPEAAPVLWNILESTNSRDRWHAFRSLENIGFGKDDLPPLTRLLAEEDKVNGTILAMLVPEAIADLLQKYSPPPVPDIASLESMLTDQNSNVQVRAALALIKFEGANNTNIFLPLHELFSRTNSHGNQYSKDLAAGILGDAGSNAKPLVPDLLTFAADASEVGVQSAVKNAVASIEPDLAAENPEIAAIIKAREDAKNWKQFWLSKNYSVDDLRAALQEVNQAYHAANLLAAMGTNARPAVPDMIRAMWWRDEDSRNKMLSDVHEIDPNVVVTQIRTSDFNTGNLHEFLDKQPLTQDNKQLMEAVTSFELFYGWVLPDELAAFTNKVASLNPEAFKTFIKYNQPVTK